MKIIADTNIWYQLGRDEDLFNKVKNEPICPTYTNIYELSISENVVQKEDYVRKAIQKMFHFKDNVIYEPPFFHIALLNCDYEYDIIKHVGTLLQFTSEFAIGDKIRQDKINEYFKGVRDHKIHSEVISDYFNKEAVRIKSKIKNKKDHRKRDTTNMTAGFINFIVESVTEKKCSIKGLKLIEIELILSALDEFFLTVELSTMKIQPNDWRDLGILGYVRPGDKYWTNEKRWKKIINDSGCGSYLFDI